MTSVHKIGEEYLICHKAPNNRNVRSGSKRIVKYTDWFLPKFKDNGGDSSLYIEISTLYIPKEFIGKRVRFKMEVLK